MRFVELPIVSVLVLYSMVQVNAWLFQSQQGWRRLKQNHARFFKRYMQPEAGITLKKLNVSSLFKNPFPTAPFTAHATKIRWTIDPMQLDSSKVTGLYGTPWSSSIVSNATTGCVYMPFWEWHLETMQDSLQNFEVLKDTSCYLESEAGSHRMVTLTASSDEYRYIRMTYMDGGDRVQVFTCLMYPRGNYPLFGIDLLRFNQGKRNMAVCDFQPIHSTEEEHDVRYEHLLEPIRRESPNLQEEVSTRVFDPSRHFSNNTLMGRFEDCEDPEQTIWNELWPAYQNYFQTHLQMVQGTKEVSPRLTKGQILEKHRAYDNYMLERDPAHRMFASIFGPEVAENYLYNVLFLLADKESKD